MSINYYAKSTVIYQRPEKYCKYCELGEKPTIIQLVRCLSLLFVRANVNLLVRSNWRINAY